MEGSFDFSAPHYAAVLDHAALPFPLVIGIHNSDYTESSLHFTFPNWLRQLRIVAYDVRQHIFSLFIFFAQLFINKKGNNKIFRGELEI
jgi:hypothetical protein